MRLLLALAIAVLAFLCLPVPPAEAGGKIIRVAPAASGTYFGARRYIRRRGIDLQLFERRPDAFKRATGFAILRRQLAERSPFEQTIRFATPEWSYRRFRARSDFAQKAHLWQSHLLPSASYPGY